MKTMAPGGPPPNRITEETQRRYLRVAPMLKHRAAARGKCPSHQSREERGERPSRWAELENEVRRFVRFSRTSPYPLIHRMIVVAAEEEARVWGTRTAEEIWEEYLSRCEAETRTQGLADLPQSRARTARCPEVFGEALDRLTDHGDAILSLVAFRAVVLESLS